MKGKMRMVGGAGQSSHMENTKMSAKNDKTLPSTKTIAAALSKSIFAPEEVGYLNSE